MGIIGPKSFNSRGQIDGLMGQLLYRKGRDHESNTYDRETYRLTISIRSL